MDKIVSISPIVDDKGERKILIVFQNNDRHIKTVMPYSAKRLSQYMTLYEKQEGINNELTGKVKKEIDVSKININFDYFRDKFKELASKKDNFDYDKELEEEDTAGIPYEIASGVLKFILVGAFAYKGLTAIMANFTDIHSIITPEMMERGYVFDSGVEEISITLDDGNEVEYRIRK